MTELRTVEKPCNIKVNDSGTKIQFYAYDDNGRISFTQNDTLLFKIKNSMGYVTEVQGQSASGGYIAELNSSDLQVLTPDTYFIELWVTQNGNTTIYPDNAFCPIAVTQNVMSIAGDVLPTTSLDDFENSLKAYVEQQASTATTSIKNDFQSYVDSITDSTIKTAGKASSDAQSAISTANTAKSTAESAVSTANTAKSTADRALSIANGIDSKASNAQSTADTATNKANNAQSTADNVTNLVNAQMVSPNLVPYSGMFKNTTGWTPYDYNNISGSIKLAKHNYFKNGTENLLWVTSPVQNKEMCVVSQRFDLEPNTQYTLSISGFQMGNADNHIYVLGTASTNPAHQDTWDIKLISSIVGFTSEGLNTINITFNSSNSISAFVRVDALKKTEDNVAASVAFTNVKIEKGTKATTWVPSIYSLKNRVDILETQIASTLQAQSTMLTQMANMQASLNEGGSK